MANQRQLRGFRILRKHRHRGLRITLLAQNGSRFVVLVNTYLWGMHFKTRQYSFDHLEQAEFCFDRLCRGLEMPKSRRNWVEVNAR